MDPNITIASTRSFNSDSLWSYELGTKTSWFDHRLTFDAAGFYIKWKNIQQEILLSCGFQYTANAGAAASKGGEIELRARPTDPLELSLGVGYQNAKITEQRARPRRRQVGSPVYQYPDWTGNGAVSYTTQLTSDWKLIERRRLLLHRHAASAAITMPPIRDCADRIGSSMPASRSSRDKFQVALVGKNLAQRGREPRR